MLSIWIDNCIHNIKNPNALVVQGPQASGKSLFADMLVKNMDKGKFVWPQQHKMEGHFNAFLENKSLLIINEFNSLKSVDDLITGETILIQGIGQSPKVIKNNLNILILAQDFPFKEDNRFIYTTPIQAIASLFYTTA